MRLFTQSSNGGKPTALSVLRALPSLFAKGARAARYELGTRWTRWVDARKVRRMRDQAGPHDMTESQAPTVIPYLQLYEHAHREHDPGTQPLQGLVALYRAMKGDGTPADQPYLERYGEPLLGWGPRVAAPLEVVDVPGGHASLLQEPNVHKLAEAMNQHLVRALDSRTGAPAPVPFVERRARPRTPVQPQVPTPAAPQTAEIDG
jgi:thioesterase domain-containing protein